MALPTLAPFALVAVIGIVALYAAYRAGAPSGSDVGLGAELNGTIAKN
jgi:hypothetical protein